MSNPDVAVTTEIERLTEKLLAMMESADKEQRVVIGISGVPGSGKSTLARILAERVNAIWTARNQITESIAVDMPMDGFRYSRAHLACMSDPATAIHRRGAAFTFDADAFHGLIQQLVRVPAQSLKAPSFDHAAKDPVENTIDIPASARIVLVEGNYCALNRRPWSDAAGLMTELWYVDVPAEIAHGRVARRHSESGIVKDEKEAWERATGTDEMNARDVRENRLPCDEVLTLI
ncbi:hypothetical protein BHE90_004176 [Fusarium euwallaceae]|uniref:Phosphoribulokinase/uridine kinase domain-containing protein n=1 Tax=Fusarium euwallaceae TaxID=1147111 RepID=A0A430LZZ9_9HYPO|nr:hypothetical protein BHE90_004176 [Fusarium euwallaceae]